MSSFFGVFFFFEKTSFRRLGCDVLAGQGTLAATATLVGTSTAAAAGGRTDSLAAASIIAHLGGGPGRFDEPDATTATSSTAAVVDVNG